MKKTTIISIVASLLLLSGFIAGQEGTPSAATEVQRDPVLRAMAEELQRSKEQLKLDQMQRPYYLEYSVVDMDQYTAEAEFGGLRVDQHARNRAVRAVVRIGDYKQDSYYRAGEGVVELLPIDNDPEAIRHQLWLATDEAYKRAAAALTEKLAALKQIETAQDVDDFSHEQPAQHLAAAVPLPRDAESWRDTLKTVSALYTLDPQLESWRASVNFTTQTRYFVNSEGTVLRHASPFYTVSLAGSTQSSDGMRLDVGKTWAVAQAKELPTSAEVRAAAEKTIKTLAELRSAPQVEEEYRGPVLMSPDASGSLFAGLVAPNVSGRKPRFGTFARTAGDYASSYKMRVLPDFITVVDDPTVRTSNGRSLLGAYDYDDEGVAARSVTLIEKGILVNYLLGRQPIRDFTNSNGHGRATPAGPANPHIANLIVKAQNAVSPEELKSKLIQMCKDQGRPYGYLVKSLANASSPRLLYRVYAKDGHEELVRGAIFNQLDTRAMRTDLIAAGNDAEVDNRAEQILNSIVAPSLLFDELEIKRNNQGKEKLPLYAPPDSDKQ
jgi:TldD protein